MKRWLTPILLLLILCVALFVRVYKLDDFPVGFHNDEVYVAYNSWSLLETGKDASGHFLPIVINQWGDYRPAGYHYFAALSYLLFGLSDWATRLPGAVFGAISVILLWLVVDLLWGRKTAWIAAVILAILPWHIMISRATSESVMSLSFVLVGVYGAARVYKRHAAPLWYITTCLGFVASFLSYHAARYAVPIFFVGLAGLFWIWRQKRLAILTFILSIILGVFSILLLSTGGNARASQISIFSFPETKLVLDESIREDGVQNVLFTRLWHNKAVAYFTVAVGNGLRHMGSNFLAYGEFLPARYVAGSETLLPLWMYGFYLLGYAVIIAGVFTKKQKESLVFLWASVVALIPAALTVEDIPNVQRASIFIVLVVIAISIGIHTLFEALRGNARKIVVVVFIIVAVYSSGQFFHEYFVHGFVHRPWYRNNGEKDLVLTLNKYAKAGERAVVTASSENDEMYYVWYLRIPPHTAQTIPPGQRLRTLFPTFTYLPRDCVFDKSTWAPHTIYVSTGSCKDIPGTTIEKRILKEDGSTAFTIFRSGATYPR